MICVSIRGQAPPVSHKDAVVAGLSDDGVINVPARLESKPDSWWAAHRGKSFPDLSIAIATVLAGDEIDHVTIVSIVRDALNFLVRVVELQRGLGVVELFHGPTFAFKDFGARMLA